MLGKECGGVILLALQKSVGWGSWGGSELQLGSQNKAEFTEYKEHRDIGTSSEGIGEP